MKPNLFPKITTAIQTISESKTVGFVRRHRLSLATVVMLAFFGFIVYYLSAHPGLIQSMLRIGYLNTALVLLGYGAVLLTNVGIMYATIRLLKKKLAPKSGLLLMIYSSLANFFGPLQSGPGVRAVYLKSKLGLRLRDFTFGMLFYYLAFAAINGALLFINTWPALTILGLALAAGLLTIGTRRLSNRSLRPFVALIVGLTLLQVAVMVFIYWVELQAVDPTAQFTFNQAAAFTGSANLSLFVSLTPGGIGIREAFLVFAGSLHQIPLSAIIAVGLVDRAIYVLFLGLLFVASSAMHLRDMFIGKQSA